MNLSKSIKAKLFTALLLLSIIPLLIISIILYYLTNDGFETVLQNNQSSTKQLIANQLNNVSEDLLKLTKDYAEDPTIINAIKSKDHEKLQAVVLPIFNRLQNEHELNIFEFGDNLGTVTFRGHNPEVYGDDKSDIPAIQTALTGEAISGFEFGRSGLSVRAFVPLIENNQIIGTLQTGLNEEIIQKITDSLSGVELNIMNEDGKILVASNKDNIGNEFNEQAIIETVYNGDEITQESDNFIKTYIPLYDPTDTEVIGMVELVQDVSIVKNIEKNIFFYFSIIGIITFIIASTIAFILSKSFTDPIKQITTVMSELSKGKLNNEINGMKRKDEFGKLSQSVQITQTNIKEMIEKIIQLSEVINSQSTITKKAINEIHIGSNQLAAAMEELAAGSEQQATASTEIASEMNQFAKQMTKANDDGSSANQSSEQVLEMTETGNDLMNHSMEEMQNIYRIVKDAVVKVEGLDERTKEIAKLIDVIQNISEQTNLLALNAAIEAARAGEHGAGFSVVADEVRKLANSVSESIIGITEIVNNIQQESNQVTKSLTIGYRQVEEGAKQMTVTKEAFENIRQAVHNMSERINSISNTLTNITTNSEKINISIENISSISQESAAGIEEATASIQQTNASIEQIANNIDSLENLTVELQHMVNKFQL